MSERLAMNAITTDILLLDVVGFSTLSNRDQFISAIIINNKIKEAVETLGIHASLKPGKVVDGLISTGDGFFIIVDPVISGYGPFLALSLRNYFLMESDLYHGIRIAVHYGSTIPFIDVTERKNFVGDGINNCSRLLENKKIGQKAWKYSGDGNSVIVSRECWEHFNSVFDLEDISSFTDMIDFSYSREYGFKDKLDKPHYVRFIESSRHIGLFPPKPTEAKIPPKP
ncbi:MAG: hypothetical protein JXB42_05950 [Deltaproteobacteria bacterium]|nr:hypothetical protein [Deltaproteobacteria bacterium]